MKLEEFMELMQQDLAREYNHMLFYLHASIVVQGLNRLELAKYFKEEAESEMKHIQEFGEMILGMGGSPNVYGPSFLGAGVSEPRTILNYILEMEKEVVRNHAARRRMAESIDDPQGDILAEFYSEQLLDSQKTVVNVQQMLGVPV